MKPVLWCGLSLTGVLEVKRSWFSKIYFITSVFFFTGCAFGPVKVKYDGFPYLKGDVKLTLHKYGFPLLDLYRRCLLSKGMTTEDILPENIQGDVTFTQWPERKSCEFTDLKVALKGDPKTEAFYSACWTEIVAKSQDCAPDPHHDSGGRFLYELHFPFSVARETLDNGDVELTFHKYKGKGMRSY